MLHWFELRHRAHDYGDLKEKTCELPDGNIITGGAKRCRYVKAVFLPSSTGKGASGFHDTSFKYNTLTPARIRTPMSCRVVRWHGLLSS